MAFAPTPPIYWPPGGGVPGVDTVPMPPAGTGDPRTTPIAPPAPAQQMAPPPGAGPGQFPGMSDLLRRYYMHPALRAYAAWRMRGQTPGQAPPAPMGGNGTTSGGDNGTTSGAGWSGVGAGTMGGQPGPAPVPPISSSGTTGGGLPGNSGGGVPGIDWTGGTPGGDQWKRAFTGGGGAYKWGMPQTLQRGPRQLFGRPGGAY